MNEKIKAIFDQVQAEEALKDRTKEVVFREMQNSARTPKINYKHFITAAVCIAVLLFGGNWLYFMPTAAISIDINPSLELGINRFERIVSVQSYNGDGEALINSLDIKYMNYSDAVERIIESEDISNLLLEDEVLTIAVVGGDESQSTRIFSNIQACVKGKENTYCYYAPSEEVEKAHEVGLSYGKYRAFLELQVLDPEVSPEEIQDMTMREIRDRIARLSGNSETGANHPEKGVGYQEKGKKQGKKNRWNK